jgi:diguanylate cyclase (GGDEF)-like protein
LIHLSEIDPLTSIFNKETTQKLIDQKLNNKEHCCFLILDVDALKSVNDNYGHAVGDKVLENLNLLFKNHFRQSDIVGRIGGDEFIILIQDENIAESRIQSLLQKVNELKIEELKDFKLSISIGIAFAPNGTTFMELYHHADQALYQTKRTGKNNYKIYKNDEN